MTELRLTNSEMSTWRDCKRKWWLSYHRGLTQVERDFNRPTGIGTRVHNALEAYYDPERPGEIDPVEFVRQTVAADCEEHPVYVDDILAEGQLAEIMLEGYMQWLAETGVDSDLRVVEPESHVEVDLFTHTDGTKVTLLSKIDARVEEISTGHRWALEHKTVQDLSMPLPLLQLDTQLLTEHLVEFLTLQRTGEEERRAQGVLYNMLRKVKRTARAKPPFYGREPVRHNVDELRHHWDHVVAVALEVLNARTALNAGENHHKVAYPSPTRDCSWKCPFFRVCSLADDGSDFEGALANLYVVGDPLARYNVEVQKEDK